MPLLDETISAGQAGHISDHQQIAGKLNDIPDAKRDYGALGDGSSDDTVPIQNMFNDLDSNFGGPVSFPLGSYVTTSTITCAKPFVTIWCWGSGSGSRIGTHTSPSSRQAAFEIIAGSTAHPWTGGATAYMFDCGSTSSAQWNGWSVHGLRLRCRFNCNGLKINQLNSSAWYDVTIEDTWSNSGTGLLFNASGASPQYNKFYNLNMHEVWRGIDFNGVAPDNNFYGGFIQGSNATGALSGSNSIGINAATNSCRFFGMEVQDFDKSIEVSGISNWFAPIIVENVVGESATSYVHFTSTATDNHLELDASVVSTVTDVIKVDSGANWNVIYDITDDGHSVNKWTDNGNNTTFLGPNRGVSQVINSNVTLNGINTKPVIDSSGGARTITLPAASDAVGRQYVIKRAGSNNVTVQRSGSDTIDGATSKTLAADAASITVVAGASGTNKWYISSTFGSVT